MSKKILCFLCLISMLLTFTACGGGENKTTDDESDKVGTESAEQTEAVTEADKTQAPSETLKVMYYNVYGYNNIKVPDRLKIQCEMIIENSPDILCLQEFDSQHRNNAKATLEGAGYVEVPVGSRGKVLYNSTLNCEPMFYREDNLKLIESGGKPFPEWVTIDGEVLYGNNGSTKSMIWGVFEEKSQGKLFLVVNAHFMWTDSSHLTYEQAEKVRLDNAKRVLAQIEKIKTSKAEYADIPVVFGGDLNTPPTSDVFKSLADKLKYAADEAETYEKLGYYGGYASYDESTGEYIYNEPYESDHIIDHAFVDGVKLNSYLPIKELRAKITSDHLPWVLTFTI